MREANGFGKEVEFINRVVGEELADDGKEGGRVGRGREGDEGEEGRERDRRVGDDLVGEGKRDGAG